MRNNKGFTLVELLCVIAILAILIIIALPNVLRMYSNARKGSFETELKSVYTAAEEEWIKDSFDEGGNKVYIHCADGSCDRELSLNGRDNLEYYIEVNGKGKIIKYYATDGTYQYLYEGLDLKKDNITMAQEVASLDDDHKIKITCDGISSVSGNLVNVTMLLDGSTINVKFKELIGIESPTKTTADDTITAILRSYTLPDDSVEKIEISAEDSTNKVYAWVQDDKIYYYSEGGTIYLNEDASYLFSGFRALSNIDFSGFNTSTVKNMARMFYNCKGLTSFNFSSINTSKVENMSYMFYGCSNMTSINLRGSNTSNVTNMAYMFGSCSKLESLDLSQLNTSKVESMAGMFSSCSSLTSLDLSHFDTSSAKSIAYMFSGCKGLTSLDLSHLNTSNVTSMASLFSNASGLTSVNLSGIDTSNVTSMASMFYGCTNLTSLDLTPLDVSSVKSFNLMFYNCSKLVDLDLTGWNTSSAETMTSMFRSATLLSNLDIRHFNTSNVKNIAYMFYYTADTAPSFYIDVTGWDVRKVTTMESTFEGVGRDCTTSSGKVVGLNTWHTDSLENMSRTFYCTGQMSNEAVLDVGGWNTSNVTLMNNCFDGAMYRVPVIDLDLSGWDTSNVTNMSSIFYAMSRRATSVKINIKNFDLSKNQYMWGGFSEINNLLVIDASNVDFTAYTGTRGHYFTYTGTSNLKIYVKDEANKEWFITNYSSVCNDSNVIVGSSS